ncbi:type 1 glutamine amidotransferase domain-containing protein [Streptomyces sp. NPDC017964]|uniref:type 1 glutamine amidotransferase domain-containing protein n=1 Tax=Streptomyces sp. NPDC017964 TaxID=3365022 RepID=UPI0037A60F75
MLRSVLFVLTSCTTMGTGGAPTGFHLGETAEPWKVLTESDFRIDVATVSGHPSEMVGYDRGNQDHADFLADPAVRKKLENPLNPLHVIPEEYSAIYFVGGHGAMWDFPANRLLSTITRTIHENGGVVSAVCHGQAALVNLKEANGKYLVSGKKLTSFSHEAEVERGLETIVPFSLQHTLQERGALYSSAVGRAPHVVTDGRLVTGQNPASATRLAHALVEAHPSGPAES